MRGSPRWLCRPLALWLLGYALLLAAWIGGNPPGAAPDEPAHHIKAVAAARGKFVGAQTEVPPGFSPAQRKFLRNVLQAFPVPTAVSADPRWGCNAFRPTSAECLKKQSPAIPDGSTVILQASTVGPYIPAPYIVIGLASRLTEDSNTALYVERAVTAVIWLILLALTLLVTKGRWVRLALLVAVTPSAVFAGSAVTTSGIEIAAGVAHAAAILALAERPARSRVWFAYGLSGAILVVTRPLGPAWFVLYAVLLLIVARARPLVQSFRRHRTEAAPALALVLCATVIAVTWNVAVMPHDHASLTAARSYLAESARYMPVVLEQSVGAFGWLDVSLPKNLYLVGVALYCVVLLAALRLGTWRDRILLAVAVGATILVALGLSAFTQLPYEFAVQGRYVMPLSVGVLLLGGSIVDNAGSPPLPGAWERAVQGHLLVPAVAMASGVLHWAGWVMSAHRAAVGSSGPWTFLFENAWEPPAGWLPWLALATAGSVAVVLGAGAAISQRPSTVHYTPTDEMASSGP